MYEESREDRRKKKKLPYAKSPSSDEAFVCEKRHDVFLGNG
jgi:hypothetical protein